MTKRKVAAIIATITNILINPALAWAMISKYALQSY